LGATANFKGASSRERRRMSTTKMVVEHENVRIEKGRPQSQTQPWEYSLMPV